jgi:hypothetical protein
MRADTRAQQVGVRIGVGLDALCTELAEQLEAGVPLKLAREAVEDGVQEAKVGRHTRLLHAR